MTKKRKLKKFKDIVISDTDNLLLNMSAGLKPKDLTASERKLLVDRFGKYWMIELGYTDNLQMLEIIVDEER